MAVWSILYPQAHRNPKTGKVMRVCSSGTPETLLTYDMKREVETKDSGGRKAPPAFGSRSPGQNSRRR